MRHERDAAITHGFRLVFGLIRLARRLIGPVPGGLLPRSVRAEIRTALRLGEALYRQAVLLMAADLEVRLSPVKSRPPKTPRPIPPQTQRPVPAQAGNAGVQGSTSPRRAISEASSPGCLPGQAFPDRKRQPRSSCVPQPPRPRALPLLDPLSQCQRTGIPPDTNRFGGPKDAVPLGHLPARLDRLERAFTDPVRRARRLAFRLARRKPSPTRLGPPRRVHLTDWPDLDALRQSQRWLQSLTREAVFAPP